MTSRTIPNNRITTRKGIANIATGTARSFLWGWNSARVSVGVLLFGAASHAAILQTEHWALLGAAEAGVGYDSNLFAHNGSDGDGYGLLEPSFTIQRLNSLTNLKVDLSVKSYTYFTKTNLNSLDPLLKIRLRYPFDEEIEATQEFSGYATRRTEANAIVGTRLRSDNYDVHWEGTFNPTGKLTLLTRTDAQRTDYLTAGFNTNDTASAGVTLDFLSNERLQLGTGYDFISSHSRPDLADVPETKSKQHRYTLRGQGEFLPKVTGSFFVGAGHTAYSGGLTQSAWDFVAGSSLSWQATERAQVTFTADRSTNFSPGGAAFTQAGVALEWTQQIAGGFTATLGADAANIAFRFESNSEHYKQYGGHFLLKYALTERLTASLRTSYTKQNSNQHYAQYDRAIVYASISTKF